jgi:hypothetical protein
MFFYRRLTYIKARLLLTVIDAASPCGSGTISIHGCRLIKHKRRSSEFSETAACRYKRGLKLAAQTIENSAK